MQPLVMFGVIVFALTVLHGLFTQPPNIIYVQMEQPKKEQPQSNGGMGCVMTAIIVMIVLVLLGAIRITGG